ncbi:Dehydrogenase (flavoprotein) [Amycolatopsis pretoriensis]|uniref:Dehydrogenase (Flavoprotein) n=1 Tax=Amycolatopsis pretoriensis TaxID=218821 RepID=A0A1H5RBL0_9PSEU|nr:Dehydrogenase (flavoprotein) [Amycolatopsis pretoriensis]
MIGAGPAGAVAAAVLARGGVPVVLVGREGDEPGYDVLVSGPAREILRSIGVTVDDWPVYGVTIAFDANTSHAVPDAGYAVVDSVVLRETLRAHAVRCGAEYRPTAPAAPHVVLAGGGGLSPSESTGVSCAGRFSGPDLGDRVVLRMLAPPADDPRGQPRCAWLAPAPGGCTIGVSALGGGGCLDEAIEALAEVEPRVRDCVPAGPEVSGPLSCGFSPGSAAGPGGLRVGDAAGLVNPFTGEGLSGAVQSGRLAARAILSEVDDPAAARREYERLLGTAFVGYFETARHAARRYHLAWRVLAAGAGSEHPFYAKGRRAVVLPEGAAALAGAEPLELPPATRVRLLPFLAACDEVCLSIVRGDWPFLARMFTADREEKLLLRPAIGFFAALTAGGDRPARGDASVAAAVELATLGALAFLGPAGTPKEVRGVDWESATTVLAGDYLLGQASRLIAEAAPDLSWSFSDWLGELAALRANVVTTGAGAEAVFASLFEFPLRVGAALGGADAEVFRACGEVLGKLFLRTEDVLALRGERTRLDATLTDLLGGRISALPELLSAPGLTAASIPPRAAGVAVEAVRRARAEFERFRGDIADPGARTTLAVVADWVAAPAIA